MRKAHIRSDQYSPRFWGQDDLKVFCPYLLDAACEKNTPRLALQFA